MTSKYSVAERLSRSTGVMLEVWTHFVNQGLCDESAVRSSILESWYRCKSSGCDPLAPMNPHLVSPQALEQATADCRVMLEAVRAWCRENLQLITETGFTLAVVSPSLWVLDLFGSSGTRQRLAPFGFVKGASWAEPQMGTNAFALAAVEHLPIQVTGAEHYRQALHALTTTAAPIWDSEGHLGGLIGFSGSATQSQPHTLALATTIAQLIREYLVEHASPSPLLRSEKGVPPRLLRGVMLVTGKGEISYVDSEGCRLLDVEPQDLVGTSLERWVIAPNNLLSGLSSGEALRDCEVRFRTPNRVLSLLMALEPIPGPCQDLLGLSCSFIPLERVTRLATRFAGATAYVSFADIVSTSRIMKTAVSEARHVAHSDEPVLLTGEAGSGKLLFAQAIHADSAFREGAFVTVDCGAFSCFSPDFLLIDLMGTVSKSEPGAHQGQPSKFELAAEGTLFLDHIESLTPRAQRVLWSVLETRRVSRIGSDRSVPLRARIVAASDTNLRQPVEEGRFSQDVFAKFSDRIIVVPALREHPEDIPPLTDRFVLEFARQLGKRLTVSEPAREVLNKYDWPGNISELRAVLGRAAQLAQDGMIDVHDLPLRIQQSGRGLQMTDRESLMTIEESERRTIIQAGWALHGDIQRMSEVLGISRTTLWRKLKSLRIAAEEFRQRGTADLSTSDKL